MPSEYMIVANWKMYLSYQQAKSWLAQHAQDLDMTASTHHVQMIICPSFEALPLCEPAFKNSSIMYGAQDCAAALTGPLTGQVSPTSLQQLGCSYTIVGHVETRDAYALSNSAVAEKMEALCTVGITPIVCIGQTAQEYAAGETDKIIADQLEPLIAVIQSNKKPLTTVALAYEPLWAIGKEDKINTDDIQNVMGIIQSTVTKYIPRSDLKLLYGGNVSAKTIPELLTLADLDGFLIGRASIDFQELKKIVLLV